MKRAASPGTVLFYSLKKDRNRSELHGSNIINCRTFLNHHSMLMKMIFMLCAEKYLLNEHESAIIFSTVFAIFYHNFSVINPLIFICGNEHFSANIN
jgi:hypothetical protein